MIILSVFFAFLGARPGLAQTWISHDQDAPPSNSETAQGQDQGDSEDSTLPPMPQPRDPSARSASVSSAEPEAPVLPVYLALKPNLNDFVGFSDGGWDGNWYVGYNSCWIVKLPKAPAGTYQRAYIGAKIGRAKTKRKDEHSFEEVTIPGKVYMAVSPQPAFTTERSYFLTNLEDVPTQPDATLISGRVGQSGWFWTEVPVDAISSTGPNYLAIWSNTEGLVSASSAPIIAAGTTAQPADAWLNRSIHGVPPRDASTALEVRLSRLLPALALKLVPPNNKEVKVGGLKVQKIDGGALLQFAVDGENVDSAWYELSYDMLSWTRNGPLLRSPPYSITIPERTLGARELYVRAVAVDALGNQGTSEPVKIVR
jgi:hypothetical protein